MSWKYSITPEAASNHDAQGAFDHSIDVNAFTVALSTLPHQIYRPSSQGALPPGQAGGHNAAHEVTLREEE